MTLFSGHKKEGETQVYCRKDEDKIIPVAKPSGCLYLGEYISKKKDKELLKSAYDSEWKRIGVIQVPHHGSNDGYDEQLIKDNEDSCIYIVSERNNDRSKDVKEKWREGLKIIDSEPLYISESPDSKVSIWCEIS